MTLNSLFFDPQRILRSGWRFTLFVILFVFVGGLCGVAAAVFLSAFAVGYGPGSVPFLLTNGIVSLFVALAVGWFCGKYLESVPFRALGFSLRGTWLFNLAVGIVLGAAAFLAAVLIGYLAGGLGFAFNESSTSADILRSLALSAVVFAIAAAFEEALFRGYILQTFARSGLAWLAIILTAVFFGAVHMGNPDAGLISSINTALAGIWFGLAYLKTRDLWFPFGLHFIWNWIQGSVFGIEVSGLTEITRHPFLREVDSGPAWLTGGTYGIEGGIACTAALLLATVSIYFLPNLTPDEELLALTSPPVAKQPVS